MDLMTLAAKITLDDSGFQSGINNAVSMGEGLAGKISSLTIAGGQLIADFVKKSISEMQKVIGGAIDGYADYQQLVGGVETLFKTSSDKVMISPSPARSMAACRADHVSMSPPARAPAPKSSTATSSAATHNSAFGYAFMLILRSKCFTCSHARLL